MLGFQLKKTVVEPRCVGQGAVEVNDVAHVMLAFMNSAATCGTIALPAARNLATRPDTP
jgi:hypothetical protein